MVNECVMDSARWRQLGEQWQQGLEVDAKVAVDWPLKDLLKHGTRLYDRDGEVCYIVRRCVGAGGNGSVYLCDARDFHLPVAIKTCKRRSQVPDLFREARLVARRRYPHVVRLYGVDHVRVDGDGLALPILVMEYLPGGNLYSRQKVRRSRGGLLSAAEAGSILRSIALGLDASQCIHRDLKPENILFDAAGRPYLTDYGVALPASITERVRFGYRFNKIIGTPGYMSPEQVLNTYHLDQRSDIFALGLMLFEMITGRMAYESRDDEAMMEYALRSVDEQPDLEQVSHATCRSVIARSLEKEPAKRFLSCLEFAEALDPVIRGVDLS